MHALTRYWWVLLLRGLVGVLFGILFLVSPGPALAALVLVFGAWALVDGILALASALSGRRGWDAALEGALGIAIGILTFARPGTTAIMLYTFIAVWALVTGVLRILAAIRLRREIEGEIWLALSGVSSIAFGVLMLALPLAGVLALAWLIGVYAIVLGGLLIGLSLQMRSLGTPATAR
jgi:uncharacterized membrane protein HdeD (DUF308 family)